MLRGRFRVHNFSLLVFFLRTSRDRSDDSTAQVRTAAVIERTTARQIESKRSVVSAVSAAELDGNAVHLHVQQQLLQVLLSAAAHRQLLQHALVKHISQDKPDAAEEPRQVYQVAAVLLKTSNEPTNKN